MIEVTNEIKRLYPSAFQKARTEKIRAVRLEPDLWYCARREAGHSRYLVRFSVVPAVQGRERVFVECRDIDNEPCKGCWQDRLCAHIAKVILMGVKYGRVKQRRAA